MHRHGIIRRIDRNRGIVRIKDDGVKSCFNAFYNDASLFENLKKGDHIRYIFTYTKKWHQFPIEILSVELMPDQPNEKQIWIRDAFAEMSRRVTAKRKEKR
jgi:hypothetical protein